jgi:hypothetical protein
LSVGDIVEGLPSACILPAAKYRLKETKPFGAILLPVRGTFPPEAHMQGEFDICPGEHENAIDFSEITRVMVAYSKYPDMTADELFIIKGVQILGDEIEVVGKVVEFAGEDKGETS